MAIAWRSLALPSTGSPGGLDPPPGAAAAGGGLATGTAGGGLGADAAGGLLVDGVPVASGFASGVPIEAGLLGTGAEMPRAGAVPLGAGGGTCALVEVLVGDAKTTFLTVDWPLGAGDTVGMVSEPVAVVACVEGELPLGEPPTQSTPPVMPATNAAPVSATTSHVDSLRIIDPSVHPDIP